MTKTKTLLRRTHRLRVFAEAIERAQRISESPRRGRNGTIQKGNTSGEVTLLQEEAELGGCENIVRCIKRFRAELGEAAGLDAEYLERALEAAE